MGDAQMRILTKCGRGPLVAGVTMLALWLSVTPALAGQPAPRPRTAPALAMATPPASEAPAGVAPGTAPVGATSNPASEHLSAAVASTGTFQPPAFQPITRPPFGPEHGRAKAEARNDQYAPDDPRFVWGFLIAMGLAALATAGFAWQLSRVRLADGREVRALTLGARLTGTLGTMTVLALGAGAMASHGVRTQTNATAQAQRTGDAAWAMADVEAALLRARLAFNRFQANNDNAELAAYSDALGQAVAELEYTVDIGDVERAKGEIVDRLGDYHGRVAAAVEATDEREAVVNSLMTPAATRATELLKAVAADAARADDVGTAMAALRADERLQTARLHMMKFLRTADPAEADAAATDAQGALADVNALRARTDDGAARTRLAEAAGALQFYATTVTRAREANERRTATIAEAGRVGAAMSEQAQEVLALLDTAQSGLEDRADAAGVAAKVRTAGVVALIGVIGAGATVVTVRTVSSTTTRVMNNLQAVAKGDLTAPPLNITSNDELGRMAQATDGVARSLRELIGQVAGSTREVAAAATEIAAASEQMSSSLRTQESQTTQVSSAVEEMAASVTEVARKSADAARAALDSGKDAQSGGAVVEGTVQEMRAISEQVSSSSRSVNDLGKKSEQIGQIIGVINDIADQTNLLALNAAIEAARAGEHGRGFAVVADEVRKLAERTTQATGEVARSIREIQGQTAEAVQQIDSGTRRVAKGVELAQNAGEALGRILTGSQNVERMVQSIAAAAEEQAAASAEISRSVSTIAASVKEAAEGSTQATQAATMLSRQAESLQAQIQRFRV
jgi:methyl-accepting chemotaxis protein